MKNNIGSLTEKIKNKHKKLSLEDYKPSLDNDSKSVSESSGRSSKITSKDKKSIIPRKDDSLIKSKASETEIRTTSEEDSILVPKKSKKFKVGYYLTEETLKQYTDIYINRYRLNPKTDKSQLICDAIALLHKHEIKK